MKKLDLISRFNHLHIEGFAIFLFATSLFNHNVFILLGIYLVFIRKRIRFILLFFGLLTIFLSYTWIVSTKNDQTINHTVSVTQLKQIERYQLLTVSYQGLNYHIYHYRNQFKVGDRIYVKGEIKPYLENTIPNGFNQKTYYLSEGIYGYIEIDEIKLIDSSKGIYSIRENLILNIDHLKSKSILMSFIFGENIFDQSEVKLYRELNVYFLLSISGIHVYMFTLSINKIAFHLDINKKTTEFIVIFFISILLYFNLFAYGVLRLFIMRILNVMNRKLRFNLTKLDLIQLSFFMLICLNRHLIFSLGFLMLYLIINCIYLLSSVGDAYNFYLKRLFLTTVIQSVILPFQLKVSLISILLMPVFSYIIGGPIFLFSIVVFLFPKLDSILYDLTSNLNLIFDFINQNNETIYIKAFTPFLILAYYVILIFLFFSKDLRHVISRVLIIILFLWISSLNLSKQINVYFLDVGQGDSAVIISNECVAIIDSYMHVSNFLRNQGIKKIDYLMLTHHHKDHTKEAQTIIDSFHVRHLVLSKYDSYNISHSYIINVKSDDQIKCGEIEFNILGPIRPYQNENDNSIVIQFTIKNLTFLFTGDIEKDAEKDLVNKYQHHLKSDVLKVAHHGSITSSSLDFINHVNPKTVIISVGRKNRYGFPHQTVIDRFLKMNAIIYQTRIHGTIHFVSFRKKQNWDIHLSIEVKI